MHESFLSCARIGTRTPLETRASTTHSTSVLQCPAGYAHSSAVANAFKRGGEVLLDAREESLQLIPPGAMCAGLELQPMDALERRNMYEARQHPQIAASAVLDREENTQRMQALVEIRHAALTSPSWSCLVLPDQAAQVGTRLHVMAVAPCATRWSGTRVNLAPVILRYDGSTWA